MKDIARVVYGFEGKLSQVKLSISDTDLNIVTGFDDEYITLAEGLSQAVSGMGSMGSHPIDIFPIRKQFPRHPYFCVRTKSYLFSGLTTGLALGQEFRPKIQTNA